MAKRSIVYGLVIVPSFLVILLIWFNVLDALFFSYPQGYGDFIANPLDPNEKLFIEVRLWSTTFTANTRMPVEVFIALNGNYRDHQDWQTNAPDSYSVLFLGTYCGGTGFGETPIRCLIEVPRDPNQQRLYYGVGNVTYSRGDQFDITLNAVGNSTEQRVGYGFISIAPTDALHEYRTFKMSLIIAIIATAFAALSVYEQRQVGDKNYLAGWFIRKR